MVRCNLDQLMQLHKLSIQMVHEKTGINTGTLSNLYYQRIQRIDLSTVEKLCGFFQCQVGELFEIESQNFLD